MSKAQERFHLVFSCEHASPHVPARYAHLFSGKQKILASHRAFDFGAIELARAWQSISQVHLFEGAVSRLLIDLNRSLDHPAVYSEYSLQLSPAEQQHLLHKYYLPYRLRLESYVAEQIKKGFTVLHVSLHSFTPVLRGIRRQAHIGILYDPARALEKRLVGRWQSRLQTALPRMQIRRNYPYRGTDDGFTVALRKKFPESSYLGIELEIRQDLLKKANWPNFTEIFHSTLKGAMQSIAETGRDRKSS